MNDQSHELELTGRELLVREMEKTLTTEFPCPVAALPLPVIYGLLQLPLTDPLRVMLMDLLSHKLLSESVNVGEA